MGNKVVTVVRRLHDDVLVPAWPVLASPTSGRTDEPHSADKKSLFRGPFGEQTTEPRTQTTASTALRRPQRLSINVAGDW